MAVRQLSMTPSKVVVSPAVGAWPIEQSVAVDSLPIEALNLLLTPLLHPGSTTFPAAVFESQPRSPDIFFAIAARIFPSHLLAMRGSPVFMTALLALVSQVSIADAAAPAVPPH